MKTMDTSRTTSSFSARRPRSLRLLAFGGLTLAALALAGCSGVETDTRPYEKNSDGQWTRGGDGGSGSVFGKGGLNILGGNADPAEAGSGTGNGVNVNAFLWRASLDTISFMPLTSADPFGGVIITDWYSTPESPQERFKVNVFILGRALRSDGLKVSVFRQVVDPSSGRWADTPVGANVATEMENAILTRARQLRVATAK